MESFSLLHMGKHVPGDYTRVRDGVGSYGAYFDLRLNAFHPDAPVVQFSTDYDGFSAEKGLRAFYATFNKSILSKAKEKTLRRMRSAAGKKEYEFDSVFLKNCPSEDT